jgi:hypothetical protein
MASNSKAESLVEFGLLASLFVILTGLFLGTMYAFDCNLFLSIPVSFGSIFLLYKLLDLLIGLRMETKKNSPHLGKVGLWTFFVLISLPVNLYINHMFNVEIFEKNNIQAAGNQKIACLEELHKQYNASFNAFLTAKRSNLITDIQRVGAGNLSIDQAAQNNKIQTAQIDVIDRSSLITIEAGVDSNIILYEKMKFTRKEAQVFGAFKPFRDSLRGIINGWQRFALNGAMKQLDEKLKLSSDTLGAFLSRYTGKQLTPPGQLCTEASPINQPLTMLQKHLDPSLLMIVFLVNALLLLPYFLAPQKTYHKPARQADDDGVTRR